MVIVLDSNVIISDYRLEGTTFRSVLNSAQSVGAQLCIPRIVLDEVQANFERSLRTAVNQLHKTSGSMGRLLGQQIEPSVVVEDFAKEAKKYRAWLEETLKSAGAVFPDYPQVSVEEMVQRAVAHKKPFAAEGDRGFKDYLIWRNVVNLARDSQTSVLLVSKNTSDFTDGQSGGGLHTDLLEDLEAEGWTRDQVVFRESLDIVLTGSIMPALQELQEIEEQLGSGTFEGLNVELWLEENLAEKINIEEADELGLEIRREFENPTVDGISDISRIDILDVRRLPSGEILIEAETDVEAEVGFYIFRGDYYALEEEVSATPWNEHYYHGTKYVPLYVHLLLTFDPEEEEVTSCEVTSTAVIAETPEA